MASSHKRPDARDTARVFKVLSVETRVRIIELLKSRSLCVNALARELSVTPAAVSQHLRILRDAGLVTPDRQGYFVHYRVNEDTLSEWGGMAGSLLAPLSQTRLRLPASKTKGRDKNVRE